MLSRRWKPLGRASQRRRIFLVVAILLATHSYAFAVEIAELISAAADSSDRTALNELVTQGDGSDSTATTQALIEAVRFVPKASEWALFNLTKALAGRVVDKRDVALAVARRSDPDVFPEQVVDRLVAMLGDVEPWGTRAAAAIALGSLGTEAAGAMDALVSQHAIETDSDVRPELRAAAVSMDPERGFAFSLVPAAENSEAELQRLIQERDRTDPDAATQALFEAIPKSPDGALLNLAKALAERAVDKREVALAVARRSDSDVSSGEVVDRLVAMLGDAEQRGTRGAAAIALGLLGAAGAIDDLISQYAIETDPDVRRELTAAAVGIDPERGFGLSLVSAAENSDATELQGLIQERDRSDADAATQALFEAVRSVPQSSEYAVFNLTRALAGRVVDKREVALAVARRPDPDVSSEQVVDTLVAMLGDAEFWGTRGGAAIALGLLASDSSEALTALANRGLIEEDPDVQVAISAELKNLAATDSTRILTPILNVVLNSDSEGVSAVQRGAMSALERIIAVTNDWTDEELVNSTSIVNAEATSRDKALSILNGILEGTSGTGKDSLEGTSGTGKDSAVNQAEAKSDWRRRYVAALLLQMEVNLTGRSSRILLESLEREDNPHGVRAVLATIQRMVPRHPDKPAKLAMALENPQPDVRQTVLDHLLEFPQPDDGGREKVVQAVGRLASDPSEVIEIRTAAVLVLRRLSSGAELAAQDLVQVLSEPGVSSNLQSDAALVLGRLGLGVLPHFGKLIEVLKTSEQEEVVVEVELAIANSLLAVRREENWQRLTVLKAVLSENSKILKAAAGSLSDSDNRRTSLARLDGELSKTIEFITEQQPPVWTKVLNAVESNPYDWRLYPLYIIIAYFVLAVSWAVIFWGWPERLIQWNYRARYGVKIPKLDVSLPLNVVTLLFAFAHRERVLNAWVERHAGTASEALERKAAAWNMRTHVSAPVAVGSSGGTTIRFDSGLKPEHLSPAVRGRRWCLLLVGEGGNGKTSLACQIARWGLGLGPDGRISDDPRYRLARHRMVPILIEPGEEFEMCKDNTAMLNLLQARLQTDLKFGNLPAGLVGALLEHQRILVVIDSLSEMVTENGAEFRLVNTKADFPIQALVATTRDERAVLGFNPTEIRPEPLGGHHLVRFLEEYFKARAKEVSRVDMSDIHGHLERIANHLRLGLGVMFAKQYAEVVITDRARGQDTKLHLRSLPDIVHEYLKLSWLSRQNPQESEDIGQSSELTQNAKCLAWACVEERLLPKKISIEQAVSNLGTEQRVKQLLAFPDVLRRSGGDIKFTLDPVAEYLAARFLVENGDEISWGRFLKRLPVTKTQIFQVRGFLNALMETCYNFTDEGQKPPRNVMKRLDEMRIVLQAFDTPEDAATSEPIAN